MTNKDFYYFNKAKEVCELSDFNRVHIGCIAVYKNIIIAKGFNTYKSNPLQKIYNKYRTLYIDGAEPLHTLHAEMMVISKIIHLDINFNKVKLYIYRKDLNNNLALCKPCEACIRAIKDLGIKEIYYTTNNGYINEVIN